MLEIRKKSGKVRKGVNGQGKVRKFEKERKVKEKSRNFNMLSERKSFTIPSVQSDDLSFYENAISGRSHGNFSDVREKSGKMKVEKGDCFKMTSTFYK